MRSKSEIAGGVPGICGVGGGANAFKAASTDFTAWFSRR